MVGRCELLLLCLYEYSGFEGSLIGCSRRVIYLVHLSSVPGLAYQLHHWLKEINIEAKQVVNTIEGL